MRTVLICSLLFGAVVFLVPAASAQHEVVVLPYAGPISPASADYITRGISEAESRNVAAQSGYNTRKFEVYGGYGVGHTSIHTGSGRPH
jgi:hypothetical protein